MAPIFAFGLGRNLSADGPGLLLAPTALRTVEACALALPLGAAAVLVYLVVTRSWWWGVGMAGIGLLLASIVGAAALVITSPMFLFTPAFTKSELAPSKHLEAYLFRSEFLVCAWELYAAAPGDPVIHKVDSSRCDDGSAPSIEFPEDGGTQLSRPSSP